MIIDYVFLLGIVWTHLNLSIQQNAKSSTFIDLITHADNQFIKVNLFIVPDCCSASCFLWMQFKRSCYTSPTLYYITHAIMLTETWTFESTLFLGDRCKAFHHQNNRGREDQTTAATLSSSIQWIFFIDTKTKTQRRLETCRERPLMERISIDQKLLLCKGWEKIEQGDECRGGM